MKIYTGFGDNGKTFLFDGKIVGKNHQRVECYGTIDELSSFIGLLKDKSPSDKKILEDIQHYLFTLGAYFAHPNADLLENVCKDQINVLELEMDYIEQKLPELKNFILNGGNEVVSLAHICRTVCRRAERRLVELMDREPLNILSLVYLNRLSDFFFLFARKIAHEKRIEEIIWKKRL